MGLIPDSTIQRYRDMFPEVEDQCIVSDDFAQLSNIVIPWYGFAPSQPSYNIATSLKTGAIFIPPRLVRFQLPASLETFVPPT